MATNLKSALTASQSYETRYDNILDQIGTLQKKLEAHHRRQAADPKNWGFDGDMAQVEADLKRINEFLGN